MAKEGGTESDGSRPASASPLSRRSVLAGMAGLGLGVGTRAHRIREAVARSAAIEPAGSDLGAIEHVVFLMLENRSFDHYFGRYPGARGFNDHGTELGAFSQSWPAAPATHVPSGHLLPYKLDAATVHAQCAGNAAKPDHGWVSQHESWDNGANDAFVTTHSKVDGTAQGPLVMGYFGEADIPYKYALAGAYTLCDAFHSSVIGPTMSNRLYSWSATIDPAGVAGGPVITTPTLLNAPAAVGSCSWATMPEALSNAGVSWKVYQPPGTATGLNRLVDLAIGFNALLYFKQYQTKGSSLYNQAFLPQWPAEFLSDLSNHTLPQVSWILPPLVQSDHPSAPPANGEWLISQVFDALTAHPNTWAKTALFITYDENGGFFDHVPPPVAPAGTPGEYLTVDPLPSTAGGIAGPIGLGFRVPALVVSPFSRGGVVNSDAFDHTSTLRFLETRFGVTVPNLTAWRRAAVGDLTSTLDLSSPNTAVPVLPPTSYGGAALAAECKDNTHRVSLAFPAPSLAIPSPQVMPA